MSEEKSVEADRCPLCGSDDIDSVDLESQGDTVIDHLSCQECGAMWDNVYSFVRQEEVRKGE